MTPTTTFAADTMLGRLARWLRLLGYDTLYGPHLSGRSLLRAARGEGRIILTRRHDLLRHLELPYLFVESNAFRQQLAQVVAAFDLDTATYLLSRCPECNLVLQAETKARAKLRVPQYVGETQETFRSCPSCHRLFWPGTHHDRIRAEVAALGRER